MPVAFVFRYREGPKGEQDERAGPVAATGLHDGQAVHTVTNLAVSPVLSPDRPNPCRAQPLHGKSVNETVSRNYS